jgi:hypothetical protein
MGTMGIIDAQYNSLLYCIILHGQRRASGQGNLWPIAFSWHAPIIESATMKIRPGPDFIITQRAHDM